MLTKKISFFIIFITIVFSIKSLNALVHVKTGNLTLAFYDINEGNGLSVERYFNSKGISRGMFGYGWGSTLEPKLTNIAGVMIMIEEAPSGKRSYYLTNKTSLSKIADRLISISEKKNGQKMKPKKKANWKTEMLKDIHLFAEVAKRLNYKSKIKINTVFHSTESPHEYIKKLPNGSFVRYLDQGGKDNFNEQGLRTKEFLLGGIVRKYHYSQGKLTKIQDTLGRYLKFEINNNGLVEKIKTFNGHQSSYKYNKKGFLVEVIDAKGAKYKFKYDALKNLVLADIPIPFDSAKSGIWKMRYDSKDRLIYRESPDGWETHYAFNDGDGRNETYKSIEVITRLGKKAKSEKYEYWERKRSDNLKYLYKTRYTKERYKKTQTYTKCCGTPLVINDNGKITRYKYKNGKLTKKVFPNGRILKIVYNKKGLPSKIINDKTVFKYKYDKKKRMIFAGNKYRSFKMKYDNLNSVVEIADNKSRKLGFDYNERKRLIKIKTKDGSIEVKTLKTGEVKFISSNKKVEKSIDDVREIYQDYIDLITTMQMAAR